MPKAGNDQAEFEDCYTLAPPPPADGQPYDTDFRVVMCDGATVGYLSGRWARTLTAAYGAAPDRAVDGRAVFLATVGDELERWPSQVDRYVSEREAHGAPLKWHEKLALGRPCATTLLAVDVRWPQPVDARPLAVLVRWFRRLVGAPAPVREGSWHAVAVGDTNVFLVRGDTLEHAFPVGSSHDFGDTPMLVATGRQSRDSLASSARFALGSLLPGDRLYICTDALAAWFLQEYEHRRRPWARLDAATGVTFGEWLDQVRRTGEMRNDDVTLVRVVVQ